MPKLPAGVFLLLIFLSAPLHAAAADGSPLLPSGASSGNVPLLPYLQYFLDESAAMDIEEIAAPELAASFAPFVPDRMPAATGILWLRFGIAPLGQGERGAVQVLDLGPGIPGAAAFYVPDRNELSGVMEWKETSPGSREMLLLPEAGAAAVTCYLRLEGIPGIWFSPTVRSPEDAAANWGGMARSAAILALAVVLCLCLVRWLTEKGQWRVWIALFVAVVLLQAIAGLPPQVGNPGLWGLAAILAPGIALMLLPHAARHLLQSRETSRAIDVQLFILTLPGMACALLPLLPGWSWIDRWMELWPLCLLIFLPTALGAWLMGLGGSRRFLLACLAPPFFTAAGVCGLYLGFSPDILASAPVWGIALAAILLAATRAPEYGSNADGPGEEQEPLPADRGEIITLAAPLAVDEAEGGLDWPGAAPQNGALAAKLSDLHDPNLRLAPMTEDERPPREEAAAAVPFDREAALRGPLDDLLREGAVLVQCQLPPAARQCAENMLAAARKMGGIVSGAPVPGEQAQERRETFFNLQQLLRDAHDSVAPIAENRGIALSWYMPPHLGHLYQGMCGSLGEILRLLLESSVRATKTGTVQLSARHAPGSSDPGQILFMVSDSGSGYPPAERSSVALARAWELVGAHKGFISMEGGEEGAAIAFSLHFQPLEENEESGSQAVVAVLCEDEAGRAEIARKLEPLGARIVESASPQELLARQSAVPAGILIVRGEMASPGAADMLGEFAALARKGGYAVCKIMAVHSDNSQDRQLAASGFTHAIPEPLDAGELRATVRDLLKIVEENRRRPAAGGAAHADSAKNGAPQNTARDKEERPQMEPDGAAGASVSAASPDSPAAGKRQDASGAEADRDANKSPLSDASAASADGRGAEMQRSGEASAGNSQIQATETRNDAMNTTRDAAQSGPEKSGIAVEESTGDIPAPEERGQPDTFAGSGARPEIASPSGEPERGALQDAPPNEPEDAPDEEMANDGRGQAGVDPAAVEAGEIAGQAESESGRGPERAETPNVIMPAEMVPEEVSAAPQSVAPVNNTPEPAVAEALGDARGIDANLGDESRRGAPGAPGASAAEEMGASATAEKSAGRTEAEGEKGTEVPSGQGAEAADGSAAQPGIGNVLDDVEWVGEPVPVIKTDRVREPLEKEREREPEKVLLKTPLPEEDFVEWVGEPMPIGTDPAQMKKAAPRTPASGRPGTAKKVVQPSSAAPREELPSFAAPAREHGNLLGDFVSRTISQVSATIEKLTRGSADAEKRAPEAGGKNPSRRSGAEFFPDAGKTAAGAQPEPAAARDDVPTAGSHAARGIDPAVFELVDALDRSIGEARKAFAMNNAYGVAEYASRISDDAARFGLRHLSKMAQCVVRAGRAGDMGALRDILPELDAAVERNRIALTQGK